jgi:nitric oxide reductase large subunit
MRYRTQAVAYPYFIVALLLYGLQMAAGLLAVAKYLGPDPIKNVLPFDVTKEVHTNLLIVWVLTGFMGAAYWVVPEESRTELYSPHPASPTDSSPSGRWRALPPSSGISSAGPRGTNCWSSRCR